MGIKRHFPDSAYYLKQVRRDIKRDRQNHTGLTRFIRTVLYHINYLWLPAFVAMDLFFKWILHVEPKR